MLLALWYHTLTRLPLVPSHPKGVPWMCGPVTPLACFVSWLASILSQAKLEDLFLVSMPCVTLYFVTPECIEGVGELYQQHL